MTLAAQHHTNCPTCSCTEPLSPAVHTTLGTHTYPVRKDAIERLRNWVRDPDNAPQITIENALDILSIVDRAKS